MESDLAAELIKLMSKFKKIKFHNGEQDMPHKKVHNSEGMMLFTIHGFYESDEPEKGKSMRASDLAKALNMSRPAVSKTLNSLEQKKLIERYEDKNDRRVVYIKLTQKGNNYVVHAQQKLDAFAKKIMMKLGEDELESLVRVLGHLYEIMKEEAERYRTGKD